MVNLAWFILAIFWLACVVFNYPLFFSREGMFEDMVGNDDERIALYEKILLVLSGPLFLLTLSRSGIRCPKCGDWMLDCKCEKKQEQW